MSSMVGWARTFDVGKRPCGVHPTAVVGGPPEHRDWLVGDPYLEPDIDPTALVHSFVTVDAGMTYKQTTTIGPRTFVQSKAHIGHNAVIGADCEICAGVILGGEVIIGDDVRIGGASWVKPLVVIGEGAIIGGGSIVTKNVPAHEVWCNPVAAGFHALAWTHPRFMPGITPYSTAGKYAKSKREWERAAGLRDVPIYGDLDLQTTGPTRYPTVQDLEEHMAYGHGAGVDGDFA